MSAPADRRRFAFYLRRRRLSVEPAHPENEFDVVVLSYFADITKWRHVSRDTKVVYEVIDSYFAVPRYDWRNVGRGVVKKLAGQTAHLALDYRKAMERMCQRADAVVCSTVEQRQTILEMCPNVHVILDYHGEDVRSVKSDYRSGAHPRLVWEGLPQTLPAFAPISPVLRELHRDRGAEFHLVTDSAYRQYANRFRWRSTARIAERFFPAYQLHEWSPPSLADVAISSDVAIIPADLEDPFSAGKPENKLLLFWRMGMPTVTAGTRAYRRAMEAVGTPWLACRTHEEWRHALDRLLSDRAAREHAALAGRAFVEENFKEEDFLSAWDQVFVSLGLLV